jgi:transcriptional regulator with XRE-family HTH domain
VAAALAREDVTRLIQLLCRKSDLTQEEVARLTGLDQSMISRVVSGKRSVATAARKQRALDGLGAPTTTATAPQTRATMSSGVSELRRLAVSYDLPDDGPVRPLPALRRDAAALVRDRVNSRYNRLLARLPQLIPELTRGLYSARDEQSRTEWARLLVQAYRAADAVADKSGLQDLSAQLIHVMRWAAEQTGDDLTLAAVAYVRAEMFFATRTHTAGRRMLLSTADTLHPGASPRTSAAYGALHMRAAVLAARAGRGDLARDHIGEAFSAASRVEEAVYDGTAFGAGSVRVHHVTLALDLRSPGEALAAAAGWVPPARMPAERRSHFHIDIADAQARVGQPDLALKSLAAAHGIAPEHVRLHPHVTRVLTRVGHNPTSRAAARRFADTIGARH